MICVPIQLECIYKKKKLNAIQSFIKFANAFIRYLLRTFFWTHVKRECPMNSLLSVRSFVRPEEISGLAGPILLIFCTQLGFKYLGILTEPDFWISPPNPPFWGGLGGNSQNYGFSTDFDEIWYQIGFLPPKTKSEVRFEKFWKAPPPQWGANFQLFSSQQISMKFETK